MRDLSLNAIEAISFARGFVKSDKFMLLFREGMGLVERTADYLDGEGRQASASLPRDVALVYATESMRLTTRLMQIASWLLVQRAVAEGEMSTDQAGQEKNKVKVGEAGHAPSTAEYEALPEGLRGLIEHSFRLQERIRHLELLIGGAETEPAVPVNAVQNQLAALQAGLARFG